MHGLVPSKRQNIPHSLSTYLFLIIAPLLSVNKGPIPTHDSGILLENGRHSPNNSLSDSFTQIKDPTRVAAASKPEKRPQKQYSDVSLEQLEDYVMQRRDNDSAELKAEYHQLPEGQQHPWEVGKSRENKHKNRFVNIIPCTSSFALQLYKYMNIG